MHNRPTIGEKRWREQAEFVALAETFCRDAVTQLLQFVWSAYDLLCKEVLAHIDCAKSDRELERSVTQYLEPLIRKVMPGESPFYVQHAPHEFETAKKASAHPPVPDIAFFLWSHQRTNWPLEAKTLRSDRAVDRYVAEVRDNFLTCRYGPFSREGGMLGYLVAGDPATAFKNIAAALACTLKNHPRFQDRVHKTSEHTRDVPPGKSYPPEFRCHHMILQLTQ